MILYIWKAKKNHSLPVFSPSELEDSNEKVSLFLKEGFLTCFQIICNGFIINSAYIRGRKMLIRADFKARFENTTEY
jgi:hypothetical protein